MTTLTPKQRVFLRRAERFTHVGIALEPKDDRHAVASLVTGGLIKMYMFNAAQGQLRFVATDAGKAALKEIGE